MEELHTRQTLLHKLQTNQDDQSWEDFTRFYEGYIYVVLRNFGLSIEDCEDLLQEVLLKLWKSLPNYNYEKDKCRFRTWLCVVIKNTVLNFHRLRSTKNSKQNTTLEDTINRLEMISESEIDLISEKEWKTYVSNLAWENLKSEFVGVQMEVFEASIEEENNAVLGEQFNVAESSIRVYKMRVRKALCKEISRLNLELGG